MKKLLFALLLTVAAFAGCKQQENMPVADQAAVPAVTESAVATSTTSTPAVAPAAETTETAK